jgi:hypothetical protein
MKQALVLLLLVALIVGLMAPVAAAKGFDVCDGNDRQTRAFGTDWAFGGNQFGDAHFSGKWLLLFIKIIKWKVCKHNGGGMTDVDPPSLTLENPTE